MNRFDPLMPVFVVLELIRPLLPVLAVVAVVELVLLGFALSRRPLPLRRTLKRAAWIGAIAAAVTAVTLPALTHSHFSDLNSVVDVLALIVAALGAGIVVALLCLPPLLAFSGGPRRAERISSPSSRPT